MMRDSAALVNTTSFSTTRRSTHAVAALDVRVQHHRARRRWPCRRAPRSSVAYSSSMRDLGEEAQAAEVDAEDRHVASRLRAMRAAMPSSVPSPPRTTTRSTVARQLVARRVSSHDVRRGHAAQPCRRRTTGTTPRSSATSASRVRCRRRRRRPCLATMPTRVMARAVGRRSSARRWSRNSTLPCCAGDRRRASTPRGVNPTSAPRRARRAGPARARPGRARRPWSVRRARPRTAASPAPPRRRRRRAAAGRRAGYGAAR